MKALYIIGAIVLLVLVGAGGFYGGVVYGQSQTQNAAADFAARRAAGNQQNGEAANGPCGFQRTGQFNRPGGQGGQSGQGAQSGQSSTFAQLGQCVARGSVKVINGNTIQISTPVSVVTVKLDTNTVISKTDVGALSDLKEGDRVTVFSRDSGDSPTASFVQIQRVQGPFGQ